MACHSWQPPDRGKARRTFVHGTGQWLVNAVCSPLSGPLPASLQTFDVKSFVQNSWSLKLYTVLSANTKAPPCWPALKL